MHAALIASPEYAHGMPGVLTHALEWLSGSGELSGGPVALLTSSPWPGGGDRARAWLRETLGTMGAVIPEEAASAWRSPVSTRPVRSPTRTSRSGYGMPGPRRRRNCRGGERSWAVRGMEPVGQTWAATDGSRIARTLFRPS
ncbi:NADPH-dependent FMN reductase [Streptomyces sp. NPDC058256]|uniref:NADPH-dependent FMN reductase n=1 Tax=Streptomyces sp. NPDC058256 TaxID=3346408 RepID=UPI0036EB685B